MKTSATFVYFEIRRNLGGGFWVEWGTKAAPLCANQQSGKRKKRWEEKIWSSICCRGKSNGVKTQTSVQTQGNVNMVISRDGTLAGLRSCSPAQPNVAVMRGSGAVWSSQCERKQWRGGGCCSPDSTSPLFC